MRDLYSTALAAILLSGCSGSSPPPPPSAPTAPAREAPASAPTSHAEGGGAPLVTGGEAKPSPAPPKPVAPSPDFRLAREVKRQGDHGGCLTEAHRRDPGFFPAKYEVTVVVGADGRVQKVDVDKTASDLRDPTFLQCLVKNLREASLPAPGREVTARFIYP